jgi:ubiquinone/menaquinone biosynthesis C-methylase UbiE
MSLTEALMDNAFIYRTFQKAVMTNNGQKILKEEIIRPEESQTVLDFGCGIGHLSRLFENSSYVGIDPLPNCIKSAKQLYPEKLNRRFHVGDETSLRDFNDAQFDTIMAIGVLHHVVDSKLESFQRESYRLLKPSGRLVTLDPVYFEGQKKINRFVISRDRGKNVRFENQYKEIFTSSFHTIEVKHYRNLLRIPYDHIYLNIKK